MNMGANDLAVYEVVSVPVVHGKFEVCRLTTSKQLSKGTWTIHAIIGAKIPHTLETTT